MKVKVLSCLLCVSVLLNIALGVVLLVGSLKMQGRLKAARRQCNLMARNLTAVRAKDIVAADLESGRVQRRMFTSLVDGQQDWYALMPPVIPGRMDNFLVVYLHGMGSTYLEPFTCPQDQPVSQAIAMRYPDAALLSCSYRKEASWGNDAAMQDITQNIRQVMQEFPVKKIVLMGTSMGGCTVLTYAAQAPPDIKAKIAGIVSVEGAGSLKALCNTTENASVKAAMAAALGGTCDKVPEAYERRSFLPNIAGLPKSVRVAIVSAKADRIVPPILQEQLQEALISQHYLAKLMAIDGGHGAPPARFYVSALEFALGGA